MLNNDLHYTPYTPDRDSSPSPTNASSLHIVAAPSYSASSLPAPRPTRNRPLSANLFNNTFSNKSSYSPLLKTQAGESPTTTKSRLGSPSSLNRLNLSHLNEYHHFPRSASPLANNEGGTAPNMSSESTPLLSSNDNLDEAVGSALQPNPAMVLELDLEGNVKFISKVWETVVGTNLSKIINKPIRNIIVGDDEDKDVFTKATKIMMVDNETYKIRFIVNTNLKNRRQSDASSKTSSGDSVLSSNKNIESINLRSNDNSDDDSLSIHSDASTITTDGDFIELEAQGIIIHDKFDIATHTMWIVKPWVPIQDVTLELSEELISTIGTFGVNLLESYMLYLTDMEITDESELPAPEMELCRICEEKVPNWWLEKHTELCLVEHRAEDFVYDRQEELHEHRKLLSNILETLHRKLAASPASPSNNSSSNSSLNSLGSLVASPIGSSSNSSVSSENSTNSSSSSFVSVNEYKGYAIPCGPQNTGQANNLPIIMQRRKSSGTLFPQIRFPFKSLESVIAYCDEALKINPGEIRDDHSRGRNPNELHEIAYSPISQNALNNLKELRLPASSDPAIHQITEDTKELVDKKLEALERYAHILQYVDRITKETNELVLLAVQNVIKKIKEHVFCMSEPESENDTLSIRSGRSSKLAIPFQPQVIKSPKIQTSGILFNNSFLDDFSHADSKDGLRISGSSTPKNSALIQRRSTPVITIANEEDKGKKLSTSSISTSRRPSSPGYSLPLASIQKTFRKSETFQSSHLPTSYSQTNEGSNYNKLLSTPVAITSSNERPPISPLLAPTSTKHSLPSIKDYEVIKPISKGAFGSVFLAKRKLTGDLVAIKVLKKSDMIAKNQVTNVKAERAIMMAQSDSKHVVQLIASFQSTHYLYLVMEYLNGGDLATLLKNMGTLPDVWAKRYIAEVIVGVNDLHSKGIVHRDLKPDNLLIDHSGHIKLTDFGLSRMGLVNRQKAVAKYQLQNLFQGTAGSGKRGSSSSHRSVLGLEPVSTAGSKVTTPDSSKPGSLDITNTDDSFKTNESSFTKYEYPMTTSKSDSSVDKAAIKDYSPSIANASNDSNRVFTPSAISSLQQDTKTRPNRPSARNLSIGSATSDSSALLSPIQSRFSKDESAQAVIEAPKTYALFDPDHSTQSRKFVGTPDYLAPETVAGKGQDKTSDWWSIGCILFEFLFGYPPFNDDTPDKVFNNILYGDIQWPNLPPEEFKTYCSDKAHDLIEKLLIKDPTKRLGADGSQEIMDHPYFEGINWETLFNEEASFVPETDHPESTDYFDNRGAEMAEFPTDDDINIDHLNLNSNQQNSCTESATTDYTKDLDVEITDEEDEEEEDPPDYFQIKKADSSSSNLVSPRNSFSRHGQFFTNRERRGSRLNDAGSNSEFGSFQFRNLMVLEKQNKDAINRLKSEHAEHRNSVSSITSSEIAYSQSTGSSGNGCFNMNSAPATPGSGTISRGRTQHGLTPNKRSMSPNPQLITGLKSPVLTFIPSPTVRNQFFIEESRPGIGKRKESSPAIHILTKSFTRTMSDFSPSSSDTEERSSRLSRLNTRNLRGPRIRTSSSSTTAKMPSLLPTLSVLLFEPIPIHRYSITRDLENLGCIVFSCASGSELIKLASGNIAFDIIFTSSESHRLSSLDLVKLIRHTTSLNTNTTIVALTPYAKGESSDVYDYVIEYPITRDKLKEILTKVQSLGMNTEEAIVTDTE